MGGVLKKAAVLAGFILVCLGAGAVGSVFTASSVADWYPALNKPALTPPSWVFGPAWSVLYMTMAVAAWLVWLSGHSRRRRALIVFGVQLFLNLMWSVIFFGLRAPGAALIELVVLWGLIVVTILEFRKIRPPAAILLIPYFLWVTFAGFLNYGLWKLN